MADLDQFFNGVRDAVDAELDRLIPAGEETGQSLADAMRWSLFGSGKRFRPALVYAVGRLFGAGDGELGTTAAAIEMLHTYSLIHDDLPSMDDDDLRRGRMTCHKRFNEAAAILAGDALQAMAFSFIAEDGGLSSEVRLRLVTGLGLAARCMVEGQFADLESEGEGVGLDEIRAIHLNKTGALIRFSAEAGALIAGAADSEILAIRLYATHLGLLFQITDDILDVVQSSNTLGKTAGKDAESGKATYVSELGVNGARELADESARAAVRALQGIDRDTSMLEQIAEFVHDRTA